MSETALTSNGQMTLPKAAREHLRFKAGDRLGVIVEEGRMMLIALMLHIDDLCTLLPTTRLRTSAKQIREYVRTRAAQRR